MSRRQLLLTVFTIISYEQARSVHHGSFIDIDDILNENLMPSSLFAMDPPRSNMFAKESNITRDEFFNVTTKKDFSSAFGTMKFHRKMMNEYQATSFLANQVMDDFIKPQKKTIEKRMGQGSDQNMLFDQGSSSYKNWLEKTSTLEDVQKHFKNKTGRKKNHNLKRRQGFDYNEYDYYEDDEKMDFSEGDVSGFAIQNPEDSQLLSEASDKVFFALPTGRSEGPIFPIPTVPTPQSPSAKSGHGWSPQPASHGHGWSPQPASHGHGWSPQPASHSHGWSPPSGHETWDDGGNFEIHDSPEKKELGFKEIVDIALTTLAFLTFGMFFLQVILCITMNKDDGNTMMMMPMEGNTTLNQFDIVEEIRRRKRGIFNSLENVNELSRRALMSSEATLNIYKDGGKCHLKVLCDNNLYAKEKLDGQHLWMPVWSLGISYLSSRFRMENTSTNILESLKAVMLGIGGGDCSVFEC
ncbi:CSNK2A2.2 family protein [Megaselia abdita]